MNNSKQLTISVTVNLIFMTMFLLKLMLVSHKTIKFE
jgi:hypothetical protein